MHGADCYSSVEGITKKVGQGKENGWSKDLNLYVVLKVHVESKGAVDRKGLQFFYCIAKSVGTSC